MSWVAPFYTIVVGSPLGLTLSNTFFLHFEKKWLQNCPSDFKPHYYRWYVDDVRILFISLEHLEAFQNFLNGWHGKISFAIENEK